MDIRKFFSKPAGKPVPEAQKPTGKSSSVADADRPPAAEASKVPAAEPAAKRSKYFKEPSATQPTSPTPKNSDKKKTATSAIAAKKLPSPKAELKASLPRATKRRKAVVESDSDDEVTIVSSSSEEDSDVELDDSDDDLLTRSKKRQRSGSRNTATKPAKKTTLPAGKAPAPAQDSKSNVPVPTAAVRKTPVFAVRTAPAPSEAKPTPVVEAKGGASGRKSAATPAAATQQLDSTAKAAIAAVDAAAKKLPPESEVNFCTVPEGVDAAGNDTTPPVNYGQKPQPRGHPDCLTGKTFVVTGVLDSLYRKEAEDLIKRHGGKVTGSVSGRTAFLLAGQNCGRSKHRAAKEKGTKIIDEDGLFMLIEASQPFIDQPSASPPAAGEPAGGAATKSPANCPTGALAAISPSRFSGARAGQGSSAQAASGAPAAAHQASGSKHAGETQLWVDKYKPRSSQELVGNNATVTTLRQWLMHWENVHLRGAAPASGGSAAKPKDLGKKAVLLSGPPGIGKTSSAHIVARELGWDIVEVNASDTRGKAGKVKDGLGGKMANVVKEMSTNSSLLGVMTSKPAHKQLLIMDEVDGMSGSDRGGVADLIQTIHKSKIPIICICNDKYSQKLRSLRNHCLELDYRKPTAQQISKRFMDIAAREGLKLNQATMEMLIEGAHGDLRLILGQLQMVRLRSASLAYDEVKGKLGTSKDADMSPFECARKLLEPSMMTISDKLELVFADFDLVPLLVQENYLNHRPIVASNDGQRMRALAKAADSFSQGDVLNRSIRQGGNWSLMPAAAVVGTIMPAKYMSGMRETFGLYPGEMNFPRFTAWLGNYSNGNKQSRLLSELTTTMSSSKAEVAGNRNVTRLDYVPALRTLLTKPLTEQEESGSGIDEVVELMQEYSINREQFDYVLDVSHFKTKAAWGEDPMKDVPTKVKSAFTRTFNQQGLKPTCNIMIDEKGFKKGKGKKAAAAPGDDDEAAAAELGGEELPPAAEEEEEEESEEALKEKLKRDGLVFNPKEEKKSGRGKASGQGASTSGRGRGKASGAGRSSGPKSGGRGRGKK